jgi:DNA-binding PadR family transcriptional regulator
MPHGTDIHGSVSLRQNDPTLLILTSLLSGPKHGYALMRDIEAFAAIRLGPGTLYGAISRLEDRGLIEAVSPTGRQRPYRMTDTGREALRAVLADVQAVVDEATKRLSRAPRSGLTASTG